MASQVVDRERLEAAIDVHDVRKSFGRTTALNGVSFSVPEGSVVGILGPNGAGKSTLMRVLTTMHRADSGTFKIGGIAGGRPADIRRLIGVLPENAGYPGGRTGLEYLTYHARLFGARGGDARAAAARWLDVVGLGTPATALIRTYSRGMLQRLGLARALIHSPTVVFLDEPTLGLDPSGRRQILGTIRDITADSGVTVLLSTHLLDDVEQFCTRVVVLHRGEVMADGTVAEVSSRFSANRRLHVAVGRQYLVRALDVLAALPDVIESGESSDSPGVVIALLDRSIDPQVAAGRAVGALLEAGVIPRWYELEGGRLSEAFFAMTTEPGGGPG